MAAPLARLRTDLAALHILRRNGVCEPEDHAGALCESMVLLIARPQPPAREQARFFRAHMAPWMARFFRDLQNARSAAFYRTVGRLGEHFVLLEQQFLKKQPLEEVQGHETAQPS
jgi:TorA maturation chaperone TorD